MTMRGIAAPNVSADGANLVDGPTRARAQEAPRRAIASGPGRAIAIALFVALPGGDPTMAADGPIEASFHVVPSPTAGPVDPDQVLASLASVLRREAAQAAQQLTDALDATREFPDARLDAAVPPEPWRDRSAAAPLSAGQPNAGSSNEVVLSPREREVLRLIVDGRTDRAIAAELSLSYRTVTTYVTSLLTKLGLPSRTAAAAYAVRHGLA
jgi:DNA-binding CsgD family transcriptional regulator